MLQKERAETRRSHVTEHRILNEDDEIEGSANCRYCASFACCCCPYRILRCCMIFTNDTQQLDDLDIATESSGDVLPSDETTTQQYSISTSTQIQPKPPSTMYIPPKTRPLHRHLSEHLQSSFPSYSRSHSHTRAHPRRANTFYHRRQYQRQHKHNYRLPPRHRSHQTYSSTHRPASIKFFSYQDEYHSDSSSGEGIEFCVDQKVQVKDNVDIKWQMGVVTCIQPELKIKLEEWESDNSSVVADFWHQVKPHDEPAHAIFIEGNLGATAYINGIYYKQPWLHESRVWYKKEGQNQHIRWDPQGRAWLMDRSALNHGYDCSGYVEEDVKAPQFVTLPWKVGTDKGFIENPKITITVHKNETPVDIGNSDQELFFSVWLSKKQHTESNV